MNIITKSCLFFVVLNREHLTENSIKIVIVFYVYNRIYNKKTYVDFKLYILKQCTIYSNILYKE